MPNIDVTQLLGDPDFVGPIQQITRTSKGDGLGQLVLSETTINTVGSVQPISGREVLKIPEAMRVANMMTFFLKGVITAVAPGRYSDVLVFRGMRFQVMTVDDWSQWGAGYSQGMCVAQVPAP